MDNQRKKSLNDILEEYQKIENELINSNGEISSDLEQKLDLHELELGEKLNGYEHFVRYLKSKIEYLKMYNLPIMTRFNKNLPFIGSVYQNILFIGSSEVYFNLQ